MLADFEFWLWNDAAAGCWPITDAWFVGRASSVSGISVHCELLMSRAGSTVGFCAVLRRLE